MDRSTGYEPQPVAGSGCHHLTFSLVARACAKQVRYGPHARDLRPMLRPPERVGPVLSPGSHGRDRACEPLSDAQEHGADVIVMGSRGRGNLAPASVLWTRPAASALSTAGPDVRDVGPGRCRGRPVDEELRDCAARGGQAGARGPELEQHLRRSGQREPGADEVPDHRDLQRLGLQAGRHPHGGRVGQDAVQCLARAPRAGARTAPRHRRSASPCRRGPGRACAPGRRTGRSRAGRPRTATAGCCVPKAHGRRSPASP